MEKKKSGDNFSTQAVLPQAHRDSILPVSKNNDVDIDEVESALDQSSFTLGIHETMIMESQNDDSAAAYLNTLTPASMIK